MDIVVIKFVAAFFQLKGRKKKKEENIIYMCRRGWKEKKRGESIKGGYVISDTYFATPSANAFQ